MTKVIGVRFQQDGKIFYFNAMNLSPKVGDYIIVNSSRGLDLGEVILGIQEMDEEQFKSPLPQALRIATLQDIQRATDNRTKEREAYRICQQKIAEHKLEMKLVSVESSFDNSKMLFYFTANGRVDFRALVKDLASVFRTRIELRQIGVRDEARMLGGLGPCGRPICCGAFLNDFQPVSIKMAKEQNLSLNPTKISGVCGRLMCCLKYEQDQYEQIRKRMPKIGRDVITPDGVGTVSDLNVVKETVSVRIPNGDNFEVREYELDQITKPGQNTPKPDETEKKEAVSLNTVGSVNETVESDREIIDTESQTQTKEEKVKPLPQTRSKKNKNSKSISENDTEQKKPDEEEREHKRTGKQTNTNRPKKMNKSTNQMKNPNEQKFGQPVRCENQSKEQAAGLNISKKANNLSPEKEQQKIVQQKKGGWADAVEKALANTKK